MLLGEMIAVALQSIRANLFRGFLTMLGIIIGVGSVITMVSLGSGAQQAIDDQIDKGGFAGSGSPDDCRQGVCGDCGICPVEYLLVCISIRHIVKANARF